MPESDPSLLVRIMAGERVFDLDTDSRILQAANGMSARLLFELFLRADLSIPGGPEKFAQRLGEFCTSDPAALIGFDDGSWQGRETGEEENPAEGEPSEYYLKLEFASSEACFYQSPLFPAFDEPCIRGYSRRSQAQFQYLRLELRRPEDLHGFIANLRKNPFLQHIHESFPQEFHG